MSKSLEHAIQATARKRWSRIEAVRSSLSAADRATFDAALANAALSPDRLAQALHKQGVTISESTIRRWRIAHGIS
jgi:hypothetical protein